MAEFTSRTNPILAQFRDAAAADSDPVDLAALWVDDVKHDNGPEGAWTREGDMQIETTQEQRDHALRVLWHFIEVFVMAGVPRQGPFRRQELGSARP